MHSLIADVAVTTTSTDIPWGAIYLGLVVGYVLGVLPLWIIFTKAGEAGWQAIIPIWNTLVLLKIAGKPMWWILLFWVPILGLVLYILMLNGLSLSFGRGTGFTVGLLFLGLIFMYVLAFDQSRYQGPGGSAVPAPLGYATA